MSDGTKIQWTDATWNLINGCTVVSPGCEHCYAMRLAATRLRNHPSREGLARMHKGKPQWTGEVTFNRAVALDPFKWTRPRRIFVCAHGDLFHKDVPDAWIDYVFMVALLNQRHTFQILTKRAERMRAYMNMVAQEGEEQTALRMAVAMLHAGKQDMTTDGINIHWPPRNVWLGVSVEDQQRADERIPELLAASAAVRWLSMEPLLGPVDLKKISTLRFRGAEVLNALTGVLEGMFGDYCATRLPAIDWVVAGGESGPDSRPLHPDWLELVESQCRSAGVPFFFKQWGDHSADRIEHSDARSLNHPPGHVIFTRVGKKVAGRKLHGVEHDAYPEAARG